MAWNDKKDYFGLADGTKIVITSSDENKSATLVQAKDEKGDVVAQEIVGETSAPSCSYVLKASTTISGIEIGKAKADGNDSYTVTQLTINTAAGSPPTIQVTGQKVPDQSHTDCYYKGPEGNIKMCHHAQMLFGLDQTVTVPDGCYLTQANYTVGGSLTTATKDGEVISYDISEGKVTASLTFVSVNGTSKPTITSGTTPTDWAETSPLTKSAPDADYPTYTCEITKALVHATVTA